jgi:hypothetical protein
MPGGDRTGPVGRGPMTGRGAGYCAGYGVQGFVNPARGGGYGRGHGWGRGAGGRGGWRHRHWYCATGVPGWERAAMDWPISPPPVLGAFGPLMTREQELEALKQQARYFEQTLNDLKNRISEVESSEEGSKSA